MKKFCLSSFKLIFPLTILLQSASAFAFWLPLSCSINLIKINGEAQSSTEFFVFKDMPLDKKDSIDLDISNLEIEKIGVKFNRIDKGNSSYPIHAITVYNDKKIIGQTTHIYTQGSMQLRVPLALENEADLFLNILCAKSSYPPVTKERLDVQVEKLSLEKQVSALKKSEL